MLRSLIFCSLIFISHEASDFENARIIGIPQLSCSKKSIIFHFESNIPFQGRIVVMRKMYIPECNQDYSLNIMRNATFKMDIGRCTDTTYMTNGSRVLSAHVEVGFHPLVITSSDRVFSVQCIDNSYAVLRPRIKVEESNCSHVVRMASRWESSTVFHVGDSVVHEWNCNYDNNDIGKVQTYLTFCNVISQAGQIIHLIDENGCIVDSELMGDLVYNNYMPKIYARAKIFKLMNDERFRIECNLQMCRKGGICKDRPFPPKCAFTKEEILNRYRSRPKENSIEDSLMTGTINNRYERQIKVSSEWITVQYNQYTNVEQLQERYYISSMMNPHLEDEKTLQPVKHFLMAISYRDPDTNEAVKPSSTEKMLAISSNHLSGSPSFHPVKISPTIDSSEADNIETIPIVEPVLNEEEFNRISTVQNTMRTTTNSRMLISSSLPTLVQSSTAQVIQKNEFEVKEKTKGKIATLHFYTDDTPRESTTNEYTSSTFHNQKNMVPMEDSFSKEFMAGKHATSSHYSEERRNEFRVNDINTLRKDMYANPRDWRLDDRTVNDTDILPERQIACSNATIIANQQKCSWSGVEHLLFIWSFFSLLIWIIMIVFYFYRNVYSKPSWTEFRERELQQAAQTRVLEQDHPWIHVDAFVEPRTRNKHEIDMNRV